MLLPVDITYDVNIVSLADAASGDEVESMPNVVLLSNSLVRLTVIENGNISSHPNYASLTDWRAGIGDFGNSALAVGTDFNNTTDWTDANTSNAHIGFRIEVGAGVQAAVGSAEAAELCMTVSARNAGGNQTVVATFPVIIRNVVDADESSSSLNSSSSSSSDSSVP